MLSEHFDDILDTIVAEFQLFQRFYQLIVLDNALRVAQIQLNQLQYAGKQFTEVLRYILI